MSKIDIKIKVAKENKDSVFVECNEANISQNFLIEDIPELLKDLPELVKK